MATTRIASAGSVPEVQAAELERKENEMIMEIKSRWTGNVLFKIETTSLKLCLEAAVKSKKDLSGSDLSGSDLSGSDLSGSDLRGSDLSGSDLSGSDLSGSDLRGSDLSGSDLSDSDLRDSDLRDSNLRDVKWKHQPDPELPQRVALAILNGPDGRNIEMGTWHLCETIHCIAGWAIHLSGPAGYALESIVGSEPAGCMLMPSAAHMFHKTNDEAIQWAKETVKGKSK